MADVMVKYYSLEQLKNKNISEKTNIEDLGKAEKEAKVSWEKLKAMNSQEAFEFLKNEMTLPQTIKGCRFLSNNNVIFAVRKQKRMQELGTDVKVLAILESSGTGMLKK